MEYLLLKEIFEEEKNIQNYKNHQLEIINKEINDYLQFDIFKQFFEKIQEKDNIKRVCQERMDKFYSSIQERCDHPITVVYSFDTTFDEWEKNYNHICPFCLKKFFDYYDELKNLYDKKRLIGQIKLDGREGKTFTILPIFKNYGADYIKYIRNLYVEIDEIMNMMQGPCQPSSEDILFDYLSLGKKQKVFTRAYKNVK